MRGLTIPSIEAFYRRDLLSDVFDPIKPRPVSFQKTDQFQHGGHFAGIMIDANKLDLDRWKYRINGPALIPGPSTIDRVERKLTERAESLGVTILRGDGVTKVSTLEDDSVMVEAGNNQVFHGRWLIGCDGGRSMIRKAGGFEFPGTEAKFTGYAVKCILDPPDKLKKGFNIAKNGMYIAGLWPNSLYLVDFDGGAFDRKQEITKEHLQTVLNRVLGSTDVNITEVHLATSFTDRSKRASSYRRGRILLAGDAAHIHPPLGGQGMNVGLGDAMNLGWKLAATVRQEHELGVTPLNLTLLDTYESERQPVADWILEWTRAQVVTMQPDVYGVAMRKLIYNLIETTDGSNLFLDHSWGLSQRYNLDGTNTHPLVGSSMPDFELHDGSRLGPILAHGRGLLVDLGDDAALKELIISSKYGARVNYFSTSVKDKRGIRALLVRPDGFVAWVAENDVKYDIDAAKAALKTWFEF